MTERDWLFDGRAGMRQQAASREGQRLLADAAALEQAEEVVRRRFRRPVSGILGWLLHVGATYLKRQGQGWLQ